MAAGPSRLNPGDGSSFCCIIPRLLEHSTEQRTWQNRTRRLFVICKRTRLCLARSTRLTPTLAAQALPTHRSESGRRRWWHCASQTSVSARRVSTWTVAGTTTSPSPSPSLSPKWARSPSPIAGTKRALPICRMARQLAFVEFQATFPQRPTGRQIPSSLKPGRSRMGAPSGKRVLGS